MVDYHDLHSITPCQCPRCRGERASNYSGGGSNSPSKYGYGSSRGGNGKKAAIVAIAVVVVVAIGGMYFVNPMDILGRFLPESDRPPAVTTTDDQQELSDVSDSDGDPSEVFLTSEEPPTTTEETQIEEITPLLETNIVLIGRDVTTLDVEVPTGNFEYLQGTIIPEGDTAVDVSWTHAGHKIEYTVFGIGSQPAIEHNRDVRLAVDGGDKVSLLIKSSDAVPARGFSKEVQLYLYVSRLVTIETSAAVPVAGAAGVETTQVSKSSGVGRDIDADALALEVHRLVNERRVENGLSPLQWDRELAIIALRHSEDMAARDYFSHDTPEGLDPTDRADARGYSCFKDYGSYYTIGIAENLFQHWTYDYITYINGIPFHTWNSMGKVADDVVDGWMKSPGHRQNILTAEYDREGVGVAIASNDKIYLTQNFC